MNALAPRNDFPLLARHPELRYLDSAATAQKPAVVLDAERNFYEHDYANPHRGAYALSARATDAYHTARERIARFVGLADADCLIFTRGTTESLNMVAAAWGRSHVRAGDEIVISGLEHHANFVPWQQLARERGATLRIARITATGEIDIEHLLELVGDRTRIVAFAHVSNALGSITPVAELARQVRARSDALLVCDGAQGVPHLPVAFDSLGVDCYAFSGHKVGGPMGIGALLARRAVLGAMDPYQTGGDMIDMVHDDHSTWNVLPHKLEAGTPNAAGAVALAAAVDYVGSLGMDRVRTHEQALVTEASARVGAIEGARVFGPDAAYRSGVVSFTLADVHPHDLATILDDSGICVRAGHHCAQPLMRRLGVPATARASFWIYNDASDIDALIAALERARVLFGLAGV